MGWQAVYTHSASLESQEVQEIFSREIRGNGFAGHLQVDFCVILVPLATENGTHSPGQTALGQAEAMAPRARSPAG